MLFTCADGHVLGFDDTGSRRGRPVIHLHGTPDARLARHPDDSLAAAAGIRLVAVDRPGYGESSPARPGDPALAVHERFGEHLGELLEHLGIGRATVLAWSGGALAGLGAVTAPALGDRLAGLAIVCGVAPREAYDDPALLASAPDRAGLFELADGLPPSDLAEMVAPMLAPYPCDRVLAAEHQREQRSPDDRAQLEAVPGAVDRMADALVEAVRNGLAGVATDVVTQNYRGTVRGLDRLPVPVQLWYGARDRTTPPELGAWYESQIPGADLHVVADGGHMLPLTHWPLLLDALVT